MIISLLRRKPFQRLQNYDIVDSQFGRVCVFAVDHSLVNVAALSQKNAPITCSWLWTTLQRRARPFSNHAVTSAVTALSALWYANVSRIGRCTNWQWPYHRALVSTSSRHNRAKQQLHIEHMLIKVDKNHGNELRPTNRKMRCHWGVDKTHRIYMNTKCDLWYNQYWCF